MRFVTWGIHLRRITSSAGSRRAWPRSQASLPDNGLRGMGPRPCAATEGSGHGVRDPVEVPRAWARSGGPRGGPQALRLLATVLRPVLFEQAAVAVEHPEHVVRTHAHALVRKHRVGARHLEQGGFGRPERDREIRLELP